MHVLRQRARCPIGGLLTTVNEAASRVAMHAVRVECCRRRRTRWSCRCGRFRFRRRVRTRSTSARWPRPSRRAVTEGFTHVAFGDLFLEDVRRYREERLAGTGLTPLFPLFGIRHARAGARDDRGGSARAPHLRRSPECSTRRFAGREFDAALLADLPAVRRSVRRARRVPHVRLRRTDVRAADSSSRPAIVVERDGFVFTDLMSGRNRTPIARSRQSHEPISRGASSA